MTAARQIGIAVVQLADHFLIGTRSAKLPLPAFDEFPGGKCLPNELTQTCAARECLEETGLPVEPVNLLLTTLWNYPHGFVELHFWLCRCIPSGSTHSLPTVRHPFRWVSRSQLASLEFPPANATLLQLLLRQNSPNATREWQITVRFFAAARDIAGTDSCNIPLTPEASLATVQIAVLNQYPDLQKFAPSLLWAVNNQYADPSTPLTDNAVVACFPPVSGG